MNRRTLLTRIGAGSLTGIAGCLGSVQSPGDPEDRNAPGGETATPTAEIVDQPCPPYETEYDTAVCSHTADTAAVSLEPNLESSALTGGRPVDDITLTFRNQSSSELTFNPHSWNIWYDDGTGWEKLQQELSGDGKLTVSPADTHSWSFMEAVESIREEPELESGLYATEIGVPDPETDDDWIACIALVHLGPAG